MYINICTGVITRCVQRNKICAEIYGTFCIFVMKLSNDSILNQSEIELEILTMYTHNENVVLNTWRTNNKLIRKISLKLIEYKIICNKCISL